MIIKRNKQRALYFHGQFEEDLKPTERTVYLAFKKYLPFPLDWAEISSDPKQGIKDFKKINLSKYSMVIGFSMGGLYVGMISDIPRVMINPGYGARLKNPDFKVLEDMYTQNPNTTIFFGENDKKLWLLEPETRGRIKTPEKNIHYFPSPHVPSEELIRDYIIPIIK